LEDAIVVTENLFPSVVAAVTFADAEKTSQIRIAITLFPADSTRQPKINRDLWFFALWVVEKPLGKTRPGI
jgi:hypothetical protein